MKTKLIIAAFSLAAASAFAQGGPGGMCMNKDAPAGCKMMSAEEMKAHHEKMAGMKDHASCMEYMAEHHKAMQERATAKGITLPDKPNARGCMGMRGRASAAGK